MINCMYEGSVTGTAEGSVTGTAKDMPIEAAPTLAAALRKITDTELRIEEVVCDISRVLFGKDDAVKNPKPNKEPGSMGEELEFLLRNITELSRAIIYIRSNLC